ncbi:MAG: hypothetical protein KJ607_05325, partial [Bacteroidetes bacterium]|nr:hypothetical protein [Bacteroidota bacterium]
MCFKKILYYSLPLLSGFFMLESITAQNIAITNDESYIAHPSAMLDVKAVDKGVLVPRLTTDQKLAVTSPATGLLVFDSDEGDFFFYNGTGWTNLTSANASGLWGQNGNRVFLNDTTYHLGIGTNTPIGKMEVKADGDIGTETAIFGVINYNGDTVFAVYPGGVRVLVEDDQAKAGGNRSGFAVGGFSLSKGDFTNNYLHISPDSVRIYIEDTIGGTKTGGNKGGFAVGGFSLSKGTLTNEYLTVTDATTQVFVGDSTAGFGVTNIEGTSGDNLIHLTTENYFVG